MDGSAYLNAPGTSRLDASYEELRRLIVTGELAPGSRILEAGIAERLGVSRRTAQSALRRLEREGLINRPGGNRAPWIVAPLTIRGFREIAEVLEAILCLVARRAAELDPAPRSRLAAELRALNNQFREAGTRGQEQAGRADQLDWEFHRHLVDTVACSRLRSIYAAQQPALEPYGHNYMTPHMADTLPDSADEHDAIVEGIERGDPDAADRATRVNWANACERHAEVIKTHGERGIL
jgi:DNA-binding GntR family transcriptional regulator